MKLALVAFALLAPLGLRAQETLTVCDGGNTNSNVPLYSLYADYGTRSQFIIPAASLDEMAGGTIQTITLYNNTASIDFDQGFTVYMMEVDYTTFESTTLVDWNSMTEVYQGTLTVSGNEMSITLDNPYTYVGENLIIGIQVTTWGSVCPSSNWQGENQTGRTALYNNANSSHAWGGTNYGVNFIPKTTFTYEPAQQGGDVCEKPATCDYSNVTATSATLTWGGGSGRYNVELKAGSDDWATVLSETPLTTTTLTLQPTTTYQARVQSVCDGTTPTSGWKTSTSFTTPCASYDIPYTYGFEDAAPFACWTPITGVTHANSSSNAHNSSYYLKFASTTSNLVALPQFNEATNNLRVEFWTRPESNTNSSCGTFSVGYMTDITDASTFVEVENYAYNDWASATYVKKTVDFINAPANANIAFRHNAGSSSWYWFVDDVTVKEIPSCVAPTALAANPSTTSAELSWTANSGETAWTLYYKKAADANYTEVTNATNPYTLQGLQAATSYLYYVVANCAAEDASEPSEPFALTTACPEYAEAPFTENFDGYTVASTIYPSARVLPTCWSFINTSTYSTNKWYPTMQYYSSTNYSNSSPNYIRFYIDAYSGSNYDPQDQYLILPAVQDVADLRIKLQARVYNTGSTYDATFKVGIMTDPTDASTFVEIAEKTPATTSYEQYIIPFNGYTGSGNHIAIKVEAPETPTASYTHAYRAVYIDDITVEEIPNCVEPSALQFVSSTTNTATLSWTAGGTESSWDIYYSTTNAAPTSSTAPLANVTTNPATISGLAASITYFVWVRAHCGDGDGQQSPWIGGISFATQCEAVTIFPWTENFESYDANSSGITFSAPCWVNEHISGDGTYFFEVYSGTNGTNSTKQLRLRDMTNGTMTKLMLPGMTLPGDDYQFTLDVYRVNATYYAEEGVRVYASTDGEIEGATELAFISRNYGTGDGNLIPAESEAGWYTYELPINISGTCYIILRGESKYGSHTYMDNFKVEQMPTCPKPSAFASSATTAHSATLSWTKGEAEQDAWQIAYSTSNSFAPAADFTPGDGEGLVGADNNTLFELTGLAQSTTYYAYVRANCGGGDYSAWNSTRISFTTPAGNRTPTGLTVDNATITSSQATASWTPRDGNTLHESYDIYWALASVEAVPLEPTAPNLISGITATSQVISGLEAEKTYKVWVRDNCGTDGYSNWSSTPFTFMTAAACQMPDGLAASNVTNNSATISWNTYGQSTFNLRYSTDGANWTLVESVNSDTYTIDGALTGNTAYQVQVQPTCADAETWSTVLNFTTKCDAVVDFPWTENFNGINSGIPSCWDNSEGTTTNNSYKWSYYATGHESYGLRFNSYNNTNGNTNFLKTPVMDFPDGKVMQLTFWYKNPTGGDFSVYISTDGGDTYETALATDLTDMSSWTEKEIVLNSYVGTQNVVIVFKGTSNYGNGDAYIYLDDVAIAEAPTCSKPSGLTFESATTTTATLSWTAGGSETSWDIYYSTENVAPTTQTGTNTTANPATIEGLNASTTYYVWVRAHCTNEDQSDWAGGISFTTQCEAISVFPWIEDFNSLTVANTIPVCWNNEEGTTTTASYKWCYTTTTGNGGCSGTGHNNTNCVRFESWSNSTGLTNFLKSPVLSLPAGQPLQLKFWYKNPAGGDFSVYISTDGGATHETALATGLTGASSWTEHDAIDLSAYAGQDVVIVFKGTSNYEDGDAYIYLDDVSLYVPTAIEKEIAANKWYAIAPPVHDNGVNMTIAGVTNLTTDTYDLYGFTETAGTWNAPTETLNQGKGYIYRRSTAATLSFVGLPNEGDKAITLTNQCPDVDIDGFNLIGNPFPHVISYSNYYTLQPNGLWLAHDAGNIGVAEGFLVHTEATGSEQIIIDDATPSKKGAPAASPAITFTVSNGEFRDVAYARFDGSAVLPKIGHLEPNAPALSIPVNGKKYAIADLGNGCESFDMVFSGIGDYTISASGDATYLHLIDKVTGKDIDLLSQPYTFKAGIGDITSRFIVKLVPDGETVSAGNFAFRNGNGWTIEGDGTLEAYDALGRRIFAQEISSSNYQLSKASFPAAGVYVLRMGGNSQKIVVTE